MRYLVETVGDETLVLDLHSSKCHCLSSPTALVWHHLQSQKSKDGLKRVLQDRLQLAEQESQAYLERCLSELVQAGLVDREHLPPSRRDTLRWMGGTMLLSTLLPAPAAAASTCSLTIVSAEWGADTDTKTFCSGGGATVVTPMFFDRTATVTGLVSGCSISGTTANGALLGDPLPGTFKELRVTYSCNGGSNQMVRICENSLISINCS